MTRFRSLAAAADAAALAPQLLPLLQAAGNPYFDWLLGGPAPSRAALERLWREPCSELSVSRVTLIVDGEVPAGVSIALDGAELARCRRADALVLLKELHSPQARLELGRRLATARDLFAPVGADELYLSRLAVAPEVRGRGFGRALLERHLAQGKASGYSRFRLDVSADNHGAISLYRSAGFAIEAERRAGPLRYLAMSFSTRSTLRVSQRGWSRRCGWVES